MNQQALSQLAIPQLQNYKAKLQIQIKQLRSFELQLINHGNYVKREIELQQAFKKSIHKNKSGLDQIYLASKSKVNQIVSSVNRENLNHIITSGTNKFTQAKDYIKSYIHPQPKNDPEQQDFRTYQIPKPYQTTQINSSTNQNSLSIKAQFDLAFPNSTQPQISNVKQIIQKVQNKPL